MPDALSPQSARLALLTLLVLIVLAVGLAAWALLHYPHRVHALLAPRVAAAWRWLRDTPPLRVAQRRFPHLWRLATSVVNAGAYLGVHLLIGLALGVAALAGFGGLAEDIHVRGDLAALDREAAAWLAHLAPHADAPFARLTHLGDTVALAALGVVVGAWLLARRRWLLLAGWTVALGGGGLMIVVLKASFRRPRPSAAASLAEQTWSFPSGHSMGTLVAVGMLAYLVSVGLRGSGARAVAVAMAAAAALLVGTSRIYLGVHYFTDVVAGFAAGTFWLAACITGVELARRRAARGSDAADPAPDPDPVSGTGAAPGR